MWQEASHSTSLSYVRNGRTWEKSVKAGLGGEQCSVALMVPIGCPLDGSSITRAPPLHMPLRNFQELVTEVEESP